MVKQNGVEIQAEEEPVEEKKKGRGRKRKANSAPQYNDVSSGFIYNLLLFVNMSVHICCPVL